MLALAIIFGSCLRTAIHQRNTERRYGPADRKGARVWTATAAWRGNPRAVASGGEGRAGSRGNVASQAPYFVRP